MCTRNTPFLVMAGTLVALAGAVSGQEVNSDVKIPPPRELAAATPAISGMFVGTGTLFTSEDQLFGETVTQAALGRLSEEIPRTEVPQNVGLVQRRIRDTVVVRFCSSTC